MACAQSRRGNGKFGTPTANEALEQAADASTDESDYVPPDSATENEHSPSESETDSGSSAEEDEELAEQTVDADSASALLLKWQNGAGDNLHQPYKNGTSKRTSRRHRQDYRAAAATMPSGAILKLLNKTQGSSNVVDTHIPLSRQCVRFGIGCCRRT